MTPQSKWIWFGFAGHFICGRWCRFHLTTRVGKYLVSTVGQFIHPSHSAGNEKSEFEFLKNNPNGEEIGYGRFYETMVFKYGTVCQAKGCACGLPGIASSELDMLPANTPGEAQANHLKLCKKWARKK